MNAHEIIRRLMDNGYKSYFVGGYVRDMLLGIESKDIDIATISRPDDIVRLFEKDCKIVYEGQQFKSFKIDGVDVVTFRKDTYKGFSDKDVIIEYANTIEEDLARRDFTINSMAYDPFKGVIIDIFNSRKDLKNKIIKFTGDPYKRILDDPNRILRACRFLAKLKGSFDYETHNALVDYNHYVKEHVAPERIRLELLKSMELEKPSLFFQALYGIGVLGYIFPLLNTAYGMYHGKYHKEDVFSHCIMCGDAISSKKPLLRLAGYLHDIGKPICYEDDEIGRHFYNHDRVGHDYLLENLPKLTFSNEETKYIANIAKVHMRGLKQASPKAIRRLLKSLDKKNIDYQDFLRLKIADRKANLKKNNFVFADIRGFVSKYRQVIANGKEKPFMKLSISGHDIMEIFNLQPGRDVGLIKKYFENLILDYPEINNREELIKYLRFLKYLMDQQKESLTFSMVLED